VDDVVVISHGRMRHASSLAELAGLSRPRVRLVTPDGERLSALAADRGWELTVSDGPLPDDAPRTAQVVDVTAREVGAAAFAAGLELFELADVTEGLEEIFLRLVSEDGAAPGDAAGDERSAA
jgi:ABC-2 type transport system ATP-binding protein